MQDASHIIGIDDAPFLHAHRGDVLVVGAVFGGARLEGVLSTRVRRDGRNATRAIATMIARSQFAHHLRVVLLQGIAVAGFNVIDVRALAQELDMAVVVVARRRPRLDRIRAALANVRGGARKWALIESAGPMENLAGVWVQRVGIDADTTKRMIERFAVVSTIPEPLRMAHLIAGGIATGKSRGRV